MGGGRCAVFVLYWPRHRILTRLQLGLRCDSHLRQRVKASTKRPVPDWESNILASLVALRHRMRAAVYGLRYADSGCDVGLSDSLAFAPVHHILGYPLGAH